jgi:hypothetical protein
VERFRKSKTKAQDPVHDLDYSSRYDDFNYNPELSNEEKLDWLGDKLKNEVTLCSHDIVKLERLEERYRSDATAAQEDKNMGCYIRYNTALTRIKVILENLYRSLKPVRKDGTQNEQRN